MIQKFELFLGPRGGHTFEGAFTREVFFNGAAVGGRITSFGVN